MATFSQEVFNSSREIPVSCKNYVPKCKCIVWMFRKVTARALGAQKQNVSFLDIYFAGPMDYIVSGLSNQQLSTEQMIIFFSRVTQSKSMHIVRKHV
jgi:hypothetical protein